MELVSTCSLVSAFFLIVSVKFICCESEVKVKVVQSCLTLYDPIDYTVHGILQARILEWVAFPFSSGSSQQGSNPGLPHCRQTLYQLSHKGNSSMLW